MVMPPCDAADMLQPCVVIDGISSSKKRRLRDRLVAVRRAQRSSCGLKDALGHSVVWNGRPVESHFCADAEEFVPAGLVNVNWSSMSFILQTNDLDVIPLRCVREPLSNICPDDLKVPSRKCLAETGRTESLPILLEKVSPYNAICLSDGPVGRCAVEDADMSVERFYRHPVKLKPGSTGCMGLGRGARTHPVALGKGKGLLNERSNQTSAGAAVQESGEAEGRGISQEALGPGGVHTMERGYRKE